MIRSARLGSAKMLLIAAAAHMTMIGGVATSSYAAGNCVPKAAEGTGGSEENAKFQVYEALLQATDWGAWAAWMANGTTPGYKVNTVKYRCQKGGLGFNCRGQTTICKL